MGTRADGRVFPQLFLEQTSFYECFYLTIRLFGLDFYLTIRPVARKGYGSIAHEAKPNGPLNRGP